MSTVMSIEGLSKSFGGLKAVNNVSFDVANNAITTVIGPNGAGKTTLFNLVSGAISPAAGRVRMGDRDVTGFKPAELQRAGLARSFQITNLFNAYGWQVSSNGGFTYSRKRTAFMSLVADF